MPPWEKELWERKQNITKIKNIVLGNNLIFFYNMTEDEYYKLSEYYNTSSGFVGGPSLYILENEMKISQLCNPISIYEEEGGGDNDEIGPSSWGGTRRNRKRNKKTRKTRKSF